MNRVILNNTFKFIFGGAIITTGLLPIFYFNLYPNNIFGFLYLFCHILGWSLYCNYNWKHTFERIIR